MNSQKNISLVFSVIILLSIGLGASSLFYLSTIAAETENLYTHPYAVSNASRNISINLISMHRYMKDVVLAENDQQILRASNLVDKHEHIVYRSFDVIFDRYLGKRSDIEILYNAFIEWKTIRDEVIFLKSRGMDLKAASITKQKGADHVTLLNKETQLLIDFADNKAKTFLDNSVKTKNNALSVIGVLLVITVVLSMLIAYYSVRRLNIAQASTKSRMHLIDQNILMAKYDLKGVVLDISSKLCRFIGLNKEDVIGQQVNFFINDIDGDIRPQDIFKIAATGRTWEGEISIVSDDGIVRWIQSAVHPELDENYQVNGYTNIIQDISSRKAFEETSITDTLTKLHNRRHFDQIIEKELKIVGRKKTSITLAIIDIDFFKKYNDHYGHPAGDDALRRVAYIFKQSLRRPNDYAFRLGGEEFGLIFSEHTEEQATKFLEIIRKRVEELHIEHFDSTVCKYVTISIGAHMCHSGNMLDSSQLYISADKALYEAKLKRNVVVVS